MFWRLRAALPISSIKLASWRHFRKQLLPQAWGPFIATTSALYTVYRMLGVGFLLIAFQVMRKQLFSAERFSKIEYAFFAVLALIDFARARVSHAAASTFAPAFGVLMNFVHLFFKDAWIGGIIALVVLLSPLIRKSRNLRMAAFALTAFSRIASVALGIAGVTGVYVVWLHLKSFSYVLTTDWGKRFAVLSVFAAFLLALAFFRPSYISSPKSWTRSRKAMRRSCLASSRGSALRLPAEMAIRHRHPRGHFAADHHHASACSSLQFRAVRREPGNSAFA